MFKTRDAVNIISQELSKKGLCEPFEILGDKYQIDYNTLALLDCLVTLFDFFDRAENKGFKINFDKIRAIEPIFYNNSELFFRYHLTILEHLGLITYDTDDDKNVYFNITDLYYKFLGWDFDELRKYGMMK